MISDVNSFLTNATEQDIQEYQLKLQKAQNRASIDLAHNAYNNRTQFIKVSKEAEKLKGEMQTLRSLMSDLTTTLGQASQSDMGMGGLDEGARKRANRSSLANLEAMWNTQLQALWRSVEGSQKYLAAIPGRHVVLEAGQWQGLDAATWKQKNSAHIVLLNDHLLVAVRKRKRIDPSGPNANQKGAVKLIADKCFSLHDIDLIDLATSGADGYKQPTDSRTLANAISIRHGHESFTFRHESPKAKAELLSAFKRTVDELRRTERSDGLDQQAKSNSQPTFLASRDPVVSQEIMSKTTTSERPEIMIDVDGKQRNFRWVEAQIDELDIEIALQQFDAAVAHVETLRRLARSLKSNTVAQDLINSKVDERAAKVAGECPLSRTPPLLDYRLTLIPCRHPHHQSRRKPLLQNRHRIRHLAPHAPLLRAARPNHLPLRALRRHPQARAAVRVRGQRARAHHRAVHRVLHSDKEHGDRLPGLLSRDYDERVCRLGKGPSR